VSEQWVKAISLDKLREKRAAVVRLSGKQLAIFDHADGVLACNNRCPHEGYPLSEGSVDGECILTCNWHNWKFDLNCGANLYGGDRLRVYPTQTRDGDVWVDITDPPVEVRKTEVMTNLRDAYDDHEYDRLAREIGRWQLLGADPVDVIAAGIDWSFERMEFGWTHAFAGAADWLTLYDEHEDDLETQLICILEAIGHMSDDLLREGDYPYPSKMLEFNEQGFLCAVEDEDEPTAVGMIQGALNSGMGFAELEGPLTRAALGHYNDFGHSLIYVGKAGSLIARLGEGVAKPLLVSLVRSIIFANRDDKIPEFKRYAEALSTWGDTAKPDEPCLTQFRRLGIDKAIGQAQSMSQSQPEALFGALLGANAVNMVGFDMSYQTHIDRPFSDNVSWLDFTHTITFADAVWKSCRRYPDTWPAGLLQLACFSGRNASFTEPEVDVDSWAVASVDDFFADNVGHLFDHAREDYIVSVHLLKTLLAGKDLVRDRPSEQGTREVLAALNRFLNEPLKRKHVRRTVRQAMAFVQRDA
jgi:nitrite reductase/ring-hydroxylating ferredoxin subunit